MGSAPIPPNMYVEFAREKFATRGKDIASEVVYAVYDRFDGWYIAAI